MTQSLKDAFAKAGELPTAAQEVLAEEILQEIEWELKWDQSLAESGEKIDRLAEKALREYQAGKTKRLGFDEL